MSCHQQTFRVLNLEPSSSQPNPLQTELPPLSSLNYGISCRDGLNLSLWECSTWFTRSLLAHQEFGFYWVVSAAVCAQAKRCKSSGCEANINLQNLVFPIWLVAVDMSSKNTTLSSQHKACSPNLADFSKGQKKGSLRPLFTLTHTHTRLLCQLTILLLTHPAWPVWLQRWRMAVSHAED